MGRQTGITDGKGNTTSYGYDSVGNLTSITSGQASNSYTYDNYSRLSAINHNSFAYNFNYDIYNQLIETKVGDQTLVSNTYESGNGNLLSTTYGNGDVISYTYDDYDRITKISNADEDIADFTYNKKGLVTKVYDYAIYQTINYQYDCHGTMVAEYAEIPANTENRDLGSILAYSVYTDGDGNTVEKTYINNRYKEIVRGTDDNGDEFVTNDGVTVTTETDDFGRLASVDTNYSSDLDYDPSYVIYNYEDGSASNSTTNLINEMTYTYGVGQNYNYVYEYEYDANNNITQVITGNTVNNSGTLEIVKSVAAEYEYDSLNQLTVAKDVIADTYTEYTYDNAGNITAVNVYALNDDLTKGDLQTTNTYSYDSVWKDKLATYTENGTANNFTYDEIGNPINYRDGMVMSWENGRQLSSITYGNDKTATFKYNSDGMRTYKDADGYQTYYYYDSENNLIALDSNGVIAYFYYDSNGEVTSMSLNETLYFFIKNQQGDIEKIVNRLGQVQVSYTYDAWGNVISEDAISVGSLAHVKDFNPFRYRGYVYDKETGLYYLQSRYYDPQTGRFLNADVYCDTQTGTPLSTNMFAYCENNPLYYHDKSGRVVETVLDIVSVIWSIGDLIVNPSWENLGYLLWDVVSAFLPFLPGSYVGKGGKLILKVANKVDDFSDGAEFTLDTYKNLKKLLKGAKSASKIEVHHLVEKRFKVLFKGVKTGDYLSVPLEKSLHKKITQRWRKQFPYGTNYKKITKKQMEKAIKKVYHDMPQLEEETLKWFRKNWKKGKG